MNVCSIRVVDQNFVYCNEWAAQIYIFGDKGMFR